MQAIQGVIITENSQLIKIEINLCDKEKKALLANLKVLTHFCTKIEFISSTFFHYFLSSIEEAEYCHISLQSTIFTSLFSRIDNNVVLLDTPEY